MQVPKFVAAIQAKVFSWSGFTLAWLSFLAAGVGGFAAVTTFPGSIIRGLASMLPYRAGIAVAILITAAGACDLLLGKPALTPNRYAVVAAAFAPSLWQVVGGKAGNAAHQWGSHVNTWSTHTMLTWLGESSLGAVAVLCLAVGFLLANKAAPKLSAGAGDPAGVGGRRA